MYICLFFFFNVVFASVKEEKFKKYVLNKTKNLVRILRLRFYCFGPSGFP